ncbi:hypothetical protein GCM10022419_131810 [Nonomuraea rosea]|uniref:Chromosome partitioning protein n=1 Tax=Nonomuraea rosea TaxID=638574 RepID=A0ABP7A2R2_9ACTN
MGLELLIGYAVAYLVRKWKRVAGRADAEVDHALDSGMDRLHEVVRAKLGEDPALVRLEREAARGVESERSVQRVQLAIADAAEDDTTFAAQLEQAVAHLRDHDPIGTASAGDHGVAVNRDMHIKADRGSVAAGVIHGSVPPLPSFPPSPPGAEPPNPSQPGPASA